jgi:hypothetical protein
MNGNDRGAGTAFFGGEIFLESEVMPGFWEQINQRVTDKVYHIL